MHSFLTYHIQPYNAVMSKSAVSTKKLYIEILVSTKSVRVRGWLSATKRSILLKKRDFYRSVMLNKDETAACVKCNCNKAAFVHRCLKGRADPASPGLSLCDSDFGFT